MSSEIGLVIVHSAVAAVAVYVPAYVLQYTLGMTLVVYGLVQVLSGIVFKNVSPSSVGKGTSTIELVSLFISTFLPLILIGMKFGFMGALGLIAVNVAVGFLSRFL